MPKKAVEKIARLGADSFDRINNTGSIICSIIGVSRRYGRSRPDEYLRVDDPQVFDRGNRIALYVPETRLSPFCAKPSPHGSHPLGAGGRCWRRGQSFLCPGSAFLAIAD